MDHNEPVRVYTSNNPTIAEMVRAALESEGIDSQVTGESQAGFAGVIPEVEVLTHARDAARAREIIEAIERDAALTTDEDLDSESEADAEAIPPEQSE